MNRVIFLILAVSATAQLKVDVPQSSNSVRLPAGSPNVVRVPEGLLLSFNQDASVITLSGEITADLELQTSEESQQFADGRWVLSALDSKVDGTKAKLETHPGNHRIGFWANAADRVVWEMKATRPGMYDVSLTYSLAGGKSDLLIAFGEAELTPQITATGSWYKYRTVPIGRVHIPSAGTHSVIVGCAAKTGGAVMNLKALLLDPAPEGESVLQADDGVILCHSKQATVHGSKLQYEHNPKKNTLGYWVNVDDWAHWEFANSAAGDFDIEILQGCGKGQGGSKVELRVAGKTLPFVVEETGHFQNFEPRIIGRVNLAAGDVRLEVRPIEKARNAIMDLRQIRLIPAK
jgi:hypothetical protein